MELALPLVSVLTLEALSVQDDEQPVGELLHLHLRTTRGAFVAEQQEEAVFIHDTLPFHL